MRTLDTEERRKVAIFPLSWTVVHPIDERSPLFGLSMDKLRGCDAEFLVLLTGFDETFSQTVHARSSYRVDELIYGARFVEMFHHEGKDEMLSVDLARIHDTEAAPLNGGSLE